jgi:prepilin peptidase CpaA
MASLTMLTTVAVIAVAFVACITDVRTRRIPNVLTFGAALGAILGHLAVSGLPGLQMAVLGWVVGLAMFLPFFLLGGMGAGDVKLMAALGAWFGPGDAFWLAIYASLAGGVMGLAVALAKGYLGTALTNLKNLLVYWWYVGPRPLESMTLERSAGPKLAYAIPIFAGVMVTVWLKH